MHEPQNNEPFAVFRQGPELGWLTPSGEWATGTSALKKAMRFKDSKEAAYIFEGLLAGISGRRWEYINEKSIARKLETRQEYIEKAKALKASISGGKPRGRGIGR